MDVHPVETGPGGGEGAEIFHHLEAGQRPGREPHLTTRLLRTVQPLAMATCPPTATTLGSSWMTRISSFSAR